MGHTGRNRVGRGSISGHGGQGGLTEQPPKGFEDELPRSKGFARLGAKQKTPEWRRREGTILAWPSASDFCLC